MATMRVAAKMLLIGLALLGTPATARGDVLPFLSSPEEIPVDGAASSDVAVLDFDGDGIPDIATVGSQRLELIRGLPDDWAAPQSVAIASGTNSGTVQLATGDLTGDGRDDIVVAIADTTSIAVVHGRADGVLNPPAAADVYPVSPPEGLFLPGRPISLALGDIDHDGSLDVAAGVMSQVPGGGTVEVLANDGHGGLSHKQSLRSSNPESVLLTPLGGDSDFDLVVANGGTMDPFPVGHVTVFPGADGATFGPAVVYNAGNGDAVSVADGDFNQDGAVDVVVGRLTPSGGYNPPPAILSGTPTGPQLGAPVDITAAPFDVGSVVRTGDANRDGRDDVLVDSSAHAGIVALLGSGASAFTLTGGAYVFPRVFTAWTLGDADGDNKLDLVSMLGYGGAPELGIYYGRGPQLRPDGAAIDFGTVALGAASTPRPVRFTNSGPGRAEHLIGLVDGDVGDFSLEDGDCGSASLAIGDRCQLSVRFQPTVTGARELDVALIAPDSDDAFWTALTGVGTSAQAAATLTPTPASTPTPPPAHIAPATPKLTRTGRARILRNGRVDTGWTAACPLPGPACSVSTLLVARARPGHRAPILVRATVTVPARAAKHLTVAPTPAGRKALRGRKPVPAVLKLSATRTGTTPVSAQRSVTLSR
jgi:hypothetical protein